MERGALAGCGSGGPTPVPLALARHEHHPAMPRAPARGFGRRRAAADRIAPVAADDKAALPGPSVDQLGLIARRRLRDSVCGHRFIARLEKLSDMPTATVHRKTRVHPASPPGSWPSRARRARRPAYTSDGAGRPLFQGPHRARRVDMSHKTVEDFSFCDILGVRLSASERRRLPARTVTIRHGSAPSARASAPEADDRSGPQDP